MQLDDTCLPSGPLKEHRRTLSDYQVGEYTIFTEILSTPLQALSARPARVARWNGQALFCGDQR